MSLVLKILSIILAVVGVLAALACSAIWWLTYNAPAKLRGPSGTWFLQSYEGWLSLYRFNRQFSDYREAIVIHWWHVVMVCCLPLAIILLAKLWRRRSSGQPRVLFADATAA